MTLSAAREISPGPDTSSVRRTRALGLIFLLLPAFGLVGDDHASNVTCAQALAIDAAALPWSSSRMDTRDIADDGNPPVFPCYTKGRLSTGGQAPPSRLAWFSFTPTASETYRIDTLGTSPDYDTILGLYTGSCGSLSPVSGICRQNGFYPDDAPGSLQSSVTLLLSAGTTYTIAVGGIGQPSGFSGQYEPSKGGTLQLNVARVAAVAYPYTYVVPSVAHIGGFVSDLALTNVEAADGQFLVQYLGHGNDGDQNVPALQPVSSPQRVAPSGSREIPDVLGTLFSISSDFGALFVQSTSRLLIGARTATPAPGGEGAFGQFTEAVDVSSGAVPSLALAFGETGRFVAVREDASARTNFVLVNASTTPCAVQSEVHDAGGNVLGLSLIHI